MQFKVVNFRAERITGWIYHPEAPNDQDSAELYVDDTAVADFRADRFRDELDSEQFRTRSIGFKGFMPPEYWDGAVHTAELRSKSSGAKLAEKQLRVPNRRLSDSGEITGELIYAEGGRLVGWVHSRRGEVAVDCEIPGHATWRAEAFSSRSETDFKPMLNLPAQGGFDTRVDAHNEETEPIHVKLWADDGHERVLLAEVQLVPNATEVPDSGSKSDVLRTDSRWSKVKLRNEHPLESLQVSPRYAIASIAGRPSNDKLVLRWGDAVSTLYRLDGASGVSNTVEFGGEIRATRTHGEAASLFVEDSAPQLTFDLRFGDPGGRRPAVLPSRLVVEYAEPNVLYGPVTLTAGHFTGWAFCPNSGSWPRVRLLRVTEQGTESVTNTLTSDTSADCREAIGVDRGGYSLRLPSRLLNETEPVHLVLQLETQGLDNVLDVTTLWESDRFVVDDEFLREQAVTADSPELVTAFLAAVLRAGRHRTVEDLFSSTLTTQLSRTQLQQVVGGELGGDAEQSGLTLASGATWYWAKQLRTQPGHLQWFTQWAIQTKTSGARDVLAYAATNQQYDFEELGSILESARVELFRSDVDKKLIRSHWSPAVLQLARLLYSQRESTMDLLDSLTLYDLMDRWRESTRLHGIDRSYYSDLLTWVGRVDAAQEMLDRPAEKPERDYSHRFLRLNTLNPGAVRNGGSREKWLEDLNALLAEDGLAPITVGQTASPRFLDLESTARPLEHDGMPLVSIVMPIYEPDEATELAVRSLINQSWSNIEIILVDDASPTFSTDGTRTNYPELMQRLGELDPRVRVVYNEVNRGAYSVRNDGYDLAQGEFVTVADKDDWHHPQKIELQATDLIANPEKHANLTNWVRVDEGLRFLIRWGPDRVIHPSFASLMFRTNEIRRNLGYWDNVRKSGDGEFKFRLQTMYGIDLQPMMRAPLAFSLMGADNLTSSDLGLGYRQADRTAYQRAYQDWHRKIASGTESAYLPKQPASRPFVAPPNFLPARPAEVVQYDVVFLSEFGFEAGNSTALAQEIEVCVQAGLKVGVLPVSNGLIRSASLRHMTPRVEQHLLSGKVDRLALDSVAETSLLVVRWPASMQIDFGRESRLAAERVVVVANHMPYELSKQRRSYDVRKVAANVEKAFGRRPLWAAQSEQVLPLLAPLVPPGELADFTWKGIITTAPKRRNASPEDFARPAVIGRHARDDLGKWPDEPDVFEATYPVNGDVLVSILGGANVPKRLGFLPETLPENWTVRSFNEIPVDDYLSGLDFFVYYHNPGLLEAFGNAVLEALNAGVVCVLPPHFEPVFKEAALYAEPTEVQRAISASWNFDVYSDQQAKARRFVERECTPSAYLERLRSFGVHTGDLHHWR